MHSNQAVSGAQRGRRVRSWLLCVTTCAIAVAASATPTASATPAAVARPTASATRTAVAAAAESSTTRTPSLGVRVVGTVAVAPSHVGVIVAVPGAGRPLNARAFRLWQNGRPEAVRVDPLPASAL